MTSFLESVRPICLAAAILAVPAASPAQSTPPQTPPAPAPAVDLTSAKRDLLSLRTLQEVYYTDHNTYSANADALRISLSDGVVLKIAEASSKGWAGSTTLVGTKGASCVMFVGPVGTIPKTEQGNPAVREGIPVCDGPASPRP